MIGRDARETLQGGTKLLTLELGRFVAASLVMLFHLQVNMECNTPGLPGPMFGGGQFPGILGVQFFFVLSGFIMVSVHHHDFGNAAAIPRFWWRRVCRIYPVYWLTLGLSAYYFRHQLTHGLVVSAVLLDPWHEQELNQVAWSLRYELAFYIMFGLCMLPYIGKPLLAYWIVLTCWRWNRIPFFAVHTKLLLVPNLFAITYGYKFVDIFNLFFFAGLAAGYVYVKGRFGWRVYAGLLLAGLLLAARMVPLEGWGGRYGGDTLSNLLLAGALGLPILALAGLERLGYLRLGRWAGWLGVVSYPLYLLHLPCLQLSDNVPLMPFHGAVALYGHFALMALAILAASALLGFLFDQPMQRWLRRVTRRMEGVTARLWRRAVDRPKLPEAA